MRSKMQGVKTTNPTTPNRTRETAMQTDPVILLNLPPLTCQIAISNLRPITYPNSVL